MFAAVVVARRVHPVVLSRDCRRADDESAHHRHRDQIAAQPPPLNGSPDRDELPAAADERPLEVDEGVNREEREPDDRSGSVQPTGDDERLPVEDAHRHAAGEEHDGRHNEQRYEQPHRELGWTVLDVCVLAV